VPAVAARALPGDLTHLARLGEALRLLSREAADFPATLAEAAPGVAATARLAAPGPREPGSEARAPRRRALWARVGAGLGGAAAGVLLGAALLFALGRPREVAVMVIGGLVGAAAGAWIGGGPGGRG
jgi:hypothetical protein